MNREHLLGCDCRHCQPLPPARALEHERKAVIFLLTPPESLRDCRDLDRIRRVLRANIDGIIEELAQTVMRAWTSEPLDPTPVKNVIENLEQHHRDLVRRQREERP